jgi:senataxin
LNRRLDFVDVLRSFLLLLKRLAQKFWTNPDPAYPKIVFDSIKDNPAFLGLLQDLHKSNDNLWTLSWMPEFLLTIQGEVAYGEVLAKMVDFLCEELQHERFDEARPIIMNSAIQVRPKPIKSEGTDQVFQLLGAVLRRCDSEKDWRHKDTLFNTLEIHSGSIVAVAFRRDHDTESWKNARISARSLVRTLLSTDVQRIHATISASCKALYLLKKEEGKPEQIPVLSVRKQLWTSIYSTIDSKDVGGLATVIVAVAKAATLAKLLKEPYRGIEKVPASDKRFVPGGKVIDQINDALKSVQSGFLEAISRFANFSLSTSALDVLRQPNVAQCIIQLLFSPVTDLQTSAQTIIGLAFDEDVRAEAIKAMFVNLPEATFDGIIDFLTQFNLYAAQAPEACPLSRSLVRCFNDILEVLCSPPGGLLLDAAFLRPGDPKGPASRLLEFWRGLTTALTMIFKRTVMWSPYHKQKEMVEWMRDAVILGRDLIARWRVIENAANGQTQGKQAKQHSGLRGKMIACFQDMLPELSKWLRLTDEELLYQSFSILQSLLEVFKETKTKPHEETLGKLTKYIADARADGKAKSRLDPSSLSKLEDAMAPFLDDASDEEVQIVGHVPATKEKKAKLEVAPIFRKDAKEKGKQKVAVKKEEPPKRNYIQVVSKPTGKSAQSRLVPDTRKPSTSRLFSDADKAKLEIPAAFPTFKRGSTVATSSSTSTLKSVPPAKPRKGEIKNEALANNSDDSSDSSDGSDDEQQVGLSALGQLTKSPTIRKQERRQIKTLEIATGRSAIAERFKNRSKPTQHNPSLRLRPDISTLHKTILSWKYDHDGSLPPGNYLQLNQVPGDFTDYAHYRRVFEPLLLLECWAQIVRSKEETSDGHLAKVSAKEYVSDWLDLDLAFTDNPPRDWDLAAETDIVLLSSPETKKSVMAKTMNYKKSPMGCVVRARCFLPGGSDPGLMQGSTWKVSKIYR